MENKYMMSFPRVIWAMFCVGGAVYLVIQHGWNPWWILLGIILA